MNLNDAHKWTNADGNVLILRGVGEDRTSRNGFKWPAVGETVTAEDWNDKPECGGGLHGWPWSFGVGEGRDICDIAHWQVCAAKPEDVVGNLENGCTCKFRTGTLVYEGDMTGAFALVRAGLEDFVRECAKNEESGNSSTSAQSGNYSTSAQSGDSSTSAQSGDYSTSAQSGDSSKSAQSGDYSKSAQSGDSSKSAQSGDSSKSAQSGNSSTSAQSGNSSTSAQSGDYSKSAQSGDYSTSESVGANSVIVAAGTSCTAKVGEFGVFALRWTDDKGHPRIAVGRVGVNGIKADVAYTVNSKGRIVKA